MSTWKRTPDRSSLQVLRRTSRYPLSVVAPQGVRLVLLEAHVGVDGALQYRQTRQVLQDLQQSAWLGVESRLIINAFNE